MSEDPWDNFKKEPFSEAEHQKIRYLLGELSSKMELLWFLWGWLATAIRDRKAWVAFGVVTVALFGERVIEFLQGLMGVGP